MSVPMSETEFRTFYPQLHSLRDRRHVAAKGVEEGAFGFGEVGEIDGARWQRHGVCGAVGVGRGAVGAVDECNVVAAAQGNKCRRVHTVGA